jgi:hypothetical protein
VLLRPVFLARLVEAFRKASSVSNAEESEDTDPLLGKSAT